LLINYSLLTENGSMSIFAQQDPTSDPNRSYAKVKYPSIGPVIWALYAP
jgi:hypothetical protein